MSAVSIKQKLHPDRLDFVYAIDWQPAPIKTRSREFRKPEKFQPLTMEQIQEAGKGLETLEICEAIICSTLEKVAHINYEKAVDAAVPSYVRNRAMK